MNQFVTQCSNSEWFKRNPHKQAGIEEKTTSLAFPYTIVGSREDVEKMFSFLDNAPEPDIALLEAEAQAELELLSLLKLL